MSHGNEDYIIASDNQEISFEEIMKPIKECPTLIDKPKLFFFQACRGENEMVNRQDWDESTSSDQTETEDEPKYKSKMNRRLEYEADLLVNNATLPDHYAFGTMNEGSVFVNSVCAVLNEAYKNLPNNMPLSQIILRINKKIRDKGIGSAESIFRLSKEVYFTPKNVSLI
jgi:hypothetical protein